MGGGGSKHTTEIRYVDNTDKVRAQHEAELADRRIREENERLRLEAEARRQEEIRQEQERIRQQQIRDEQARIESEKRQKVLAGTQKLINYAFPGYNHVNSFSGEDISDVNCLRIALFGTTGAGKSAFISTCERVMQRQPTAQIQSSGGEGTIVLEDFLTEFFFHLVDTRGFFNYDVNENNELKAILDGNIRPGEIIERSDDNRIDFDNYVNPISEQVHAAILVVKANDPRLKEGVLSSNMQIGREYLKRRGITVVCLVTHADMLSSDHERQEALERASEATGSPKDHTFLIANYTNTATQQQNWDTELMAVTVLERAIIAAERFVKLRKLDERNRRIKASRQQA